MFLQCRFDFIKGTSGTSSNDYSSLILEIKHFQVFLFVSRSAKSLANFKVVLRLRMLTTG